MSNIAENLCSRTRVNSIVLRVSRIEMAWVNANWVYRLDYGYLVNDPDLTSL